MYILTHRSVFASAKLLAHELGIRVTTHLRDNPPLIRWGCSDGNYREDTEHNNRELIRLSSQKLAFSERMRGANIPCVEYHRGEFPQSYPVVIRTIANGHGGDGIVIVRNEREYRQVGTHFIWSYWYTFGFELGVHILGGRIVRVFKKVRETGEPEEEFPLRNLERGYSFRLKNMEDYPKLTPLVNQFFANFPINMARLDVGWDSQNRVYRIIESNSAPGLSRNEVTLGIYTDYLRTLLR